jgi:uncharacterized protein YbcI
MEHIRQLGRGGEVELAREADDGGGSSALDGAIEPGSVGERKLAATGRSQFVRDTRKAFQDAMRDEFIAEVEALTGRTVVAFLSDNHIDPDVAIEAFQLDSRDDGA